MRMRYTKDKLEFAISGAKSWAAVCRYFNVKPATGSQSHIKKRAEGFGLDFSHFTGRGWSRGKSFKRRPIQDYLVKDGPFIGSHALKLRLYDEGIKDRVCELCGLREWMSKEIRFDLDHINGDHGDNRLDNLRIVCPNCHSQTPTYCKTRATREIGTPI